MRIKIKEVKSFFKSILGESSLRKFCELNKLNYSTMKNYYQGKHSLPRELFDFLVSLSNDGSYWERKKICLKDSWGFIKAGKISASLQDNKKRMQHARSFIKGIVTEFKVDEFFCEFYGALLGDGCITTFIDAAGFRKFELVLTGNKALDSNYLLQFKLKLKQKWDIYSYYYESKTKNVCWLKIRNKSLAMFLHKNFGFPVGKKKGKLHIPKSLLSLDWSIKKYLLRGLFYTDGSIYAKKREKYRYPIISFSSYDFNLLNQMKEMLIKVGYPAYRSTHNLRVRGITNVNRWFNDVGSSNDRNILKYAFFKENGYIPAGLLVQK